MLNRRKRFLLNETAYKHSCRNALCTIFFCLVDVLVHQIAVARSIECCLFCRMPSATDNDNNN